MKTVILSKNRYIYSTDILVKEFNRRGLQVNVVNPLECDVCIDGANSLVLHNDKVINNTSFVIPRIGSASPFYGIYVIQAYETLEVPTLNSYTGVINSRNKHSSYERLRKNNLPTPNTVLVKSTNNLDFILPKINGLPVVIKLTRGSQGRGIMIAESHNSLKSIIDTMTLLEEEIILQEYFETDPKNSDIRVYVLNNTVIGGTQRVNKYDFRSNTHCGGNMSQIEIDQSIKNLALKAADCFGLNFCSIDFLITNQGPKIIEINSTPGFEKVETEAGLRISKILVDYIQQRICTTNMKI